MGEERYEGKIESREYLPGDDGSGMGLTGKWMNKRTGKEISEISKNLFVDINDTSAYRIQNGIVHNIINKDYELIDTTEIDDCSSVINSLYDKF